MEIFKSNCNCQLQFLLKFAQNFLYTQNEQKQSPYLKRAPFKYPKWKFTSEINHFVVLANLTQNFLQFQNKQN